MVAELRWRVSGDGLPGEPLELRLHIAESASVGEVADALAEVLTTAGGTSRPRPAGHCASHTLTLSHGGHVLPPGAPAARACPRSGAAVHVVGALAAGEEDPIAPAHLQLRDGGTTPLRWGANDVAGPAGTLVGVQVHVHTTIVVAVTGTEHLYVDGRVVRGTATLHDGALLRCGGWEATVHRPAVLHPPPPAGPTVEVPVHRAAVISHHPEPVELPTPPEPSRPPGFPWLSAFVPLAMGATLWAVTGSAWSVGFMAFGVAFVVAAGIEARREATADERFRIRWFRSDLHTAAERLDELAAAESDRDGTHHPSGSELLGWMHPIGHRLWERGGLHPHPLVVRVGTLHAVPDDPPVVPNRGLPELRAEAAEVAAAHQTRPRPATVDLDARGGLAIVGDPRHTEGLLHSVLLQLAVLVPPDRLRLSVAAELRSTTLAWTLWLPHDHEGSPVVCVGTRTDSPSAPGGPAPLVWVGQDTAALPESVRAVIHVHDHGADLQYGNDAPRAVVVDTVDAADALEAARVLCGLRPSGGAAASMPASDLRTLGLGLAAEEVQRQWCVQRPGLATPIGHTGAGHLLVDLEADGPHVLVAGTTGSGKSELLRTLVCGLAALHPPSRVNFLLVDYKGGAAFGALDRLPHTAALVTDLTPTLVQRALVSLRAELRSRERVLQAADCDSVDAMPPSTRPPSLVVVVDEFATLVSDVPGFLDGVLDVAQRGRSLGVHLVLATQRPAGVVSDAVRANTSLRIALRLPDTQDSLDVIDHPGAVDLPRTHPGAALVRFDSGAPQRVRVAHTGAPASPPPAVLVVPLGTPLAPSRADRRDRTAEDTQLDLLVRSARRAATVLGHSPATAPWAPPLPTTLAVAEVPSRPEGDTGSLPIGVVDEPHLQRRSVLTVRPRDGGVLALGAQGAGTSTTLCTLAAAAVAHGLRVVAIDAGGTLAGRCAPGPTGLLLPAADHEPLHRELASLAARFHDTPRSTGTTPDTLLLIDGWAAFESAQGAINRAAALNIVERLATEGGRVGVVVAIAARRRNEVPPAVAHSLTHRLVHRCVDADDAAVSDAPPELAGADVPPGRIHTAGHWAQVAIGPEVAAPPPPSRLGPAVAISELAAAHPVAAQPSGATLAIGVAAGSLGPAHVELGHAALLVAGPPGSGRTTALHTIAAAARLAGFATAAAGPDPREGLRHLRDDPPASPCVVLLDDLDRWIDLPEADDLLVELVGPRCPGSLHVVVAGDSLRLQRCFAESVGLLRANRHGLLLRGAGTASGIAGTGPAGGTGATAGGIDDEIAGVLHVDLPRRDDLPLAPGRGWLIRGRPLDIVQLALP